MTSTQKELPYEATRKQTEAADELALSLNIPNMEWLPEYNLLLALFMERETNRWLLEQRLRRLEGNVSNLRRKLRAEHPILNDLGEFQGQFSGVEAGVGAFDASQKALDNFIKAHKTPENKESVR